jgi:hypothetical protein
MDQLKLRDTTADPGRNLVPEITLTVEYNGFFALAVNISADDATKYEVVIVLKLIVSICRYIMNYTTGSGKFIIIQVVVGFSCKKNDAAGGSYHLGNQKVDLFSTTDMIKWKKQEDVKISLEWPSGSINATEYHKGKDENIFDYSFNYKKIVHGDYRQK